VFQRLNEQDKAARLKTKDLQFLWTPKFSGKNDQEGAYDNEIFGHVLFDSYHSPNEFISSSWSK
jgi:hypothetical protein